MIATASAAVVLTLIVWRARATGRSEAASIAATDLAAGTLVAKASDAGGLAGPASGSEVVPAKFQNTFCDVPVTGRTVAFVVDRDASMAEYIDRVAFLTCAAAVGMQTRGVGRFGVVSAADGAPKVVRPAMVSDTSLADAASILYGGFHERRTDLSAAVGATVGWRADQLFLVVARPLPPEEIEALIQKVQESGAETHLVALGEAARLQGQSLLAVARSTGGTMLALTDERFADVFNEVRAAQATATLEKFEEEARN